jgi:glycosyltransferase involved in cell wall biosynthesis
MTLGVSRYGDAVAVTPVEARRDSRILKQCMSLARAGFRSVLFEGRQSHPPIVLPGVEIVGLTGAISSTRLAGAPGQRCDLATRLKERITGPNATWFEAWTGFAAYLMLYLGHFVIGGIRYMPPASLYYLSEFSFFPAVWVKSKWHGAAIAYDARDYYVGIETASNKTRFQKLVVGFGRFIEKICVKEVQVFTTVGEGVASLFEREYGRRPEVIHNAHDDRIDQVCQKTLRQRVGLRRDETLLVIVGNAKPGQDISGTLGALERLPMVHLALVGNGYRRSLASRRFSTGIAARLHFIEDVPATEVVPLIRDADVALLIYFEHSENYKNALPNGFFQSVAAKLPLLHGGLPEISRVCRDFDFGVTVAPDDADALTAILTQVVQRTDWYNEQRLRSAKAASSLTWQNAEARLQQLLIEAATRHASKLA